MKLHQFIMSKQPGTRTLRHLLFWAVIYAPMIGISCVPLIEYKWEVEPAFEKILFWQLIYLRYLVVDILFSYIVAYHLIPRYLNKKKYKSFTGAFVLLVMAVYIFSAALSITRYSGYHQPFVLDLWKHTQVFINSGPIIRCALFLFVIGVKNYYVQMEQRMDLLKENARAELQLLKAQVHPHFLFNTLNNIYSFMLTQSPQASQLLGKLSTTLHYMVTDCETSLVSLSKEINMLKDYIGLEKVRYGERLHIETTFPAEDKDCLVTPLLLIPFIENAFKHGASKVLENPWIVLRIGVRKGRMYFFVSNNKPSGLIKSNGKSGIGLKNVKKRLELLYAGQYLLRIDETENTYSVDMELPVVYRSTEKRPDASIKEQGILTLS